MPLHSSVGNSVSDTGGEYRSSQSESISFLPYDTWFQVSQAKVDNDYIWDIAATIEKEEFLFLFALSCCASSLATQWLEIEANHNKAEMRYGDRFLVILCEHLVEVRYTLGLVSMDTV